MEFIIISIIAIILIGYLVVTFIIIRRFLGLEPVSPEVQTLIKEVKQTVKEANKNIAIAINAIDNITLKHYVFQWNSIENIQPVFINNDARVKIILSDYFLTVGVNANVLLLEQEPSGYTPTQEKPVVIQWSGLVSAGACA